MQKRSLSLPLRFVTTHWSAIQRAGVAGNDTKQALASLIESYWYPLYAFCRRQGHRDHDAMDLTQAFLTHLLSGESLRTVKPEKGRFRSFLLASFTNFMSNQRRAASAERRGGGVKVMSIDHADFGTRYASEPVEHDTPERLFERAFVEGMLERVHLRLAQDYTDAGKSELFDLLEPHLTEQFDAIPRAEIGRRLQLSPAAVNMSLYRMRRRYGELLRAEVTLTVDDPADVDAELNALLGIISRDA